jgi:small subunit ribosomal protein S6
MENTYELTYILTPILEEDAVQKQVDLVNSWIESNGGKIDEVDQWGLKKFATPMEGKSNGYYINIYFTAPSDTVKVIERNMKINDEFIRHMVLKYDAKMKRYRELQKKGEVPTIFTNEPETVEEEA